jgi:hypothetical protein
MAISSRYYKSPKHRERLSRALKGKRPRLTKEQRAHRSYMATITQLGKKRGPYKKKTREEKLAKTGDPLAWLKDYI